ncbi:MAG: ABC transporter ATP-binding protein [Cumulibacter sp.]
MTTTKQTETDIVIQVRGLRKVFPLGKNLLGRPTSRTVAVDGVNLTLARGKTLGIVGESGSGKTTVGRLIAKLGDADEGDIVVAGQDVSSARGSRLKEFRRRLQVVFQDPYGSLDPTKTVSDAIAEPMLVHGLASRRDAERAVVDLLQEVGLDPVYGRRYPRQLSGGQRQRVAIARAMALQPEVLIADEPTSALDLSTRSGILNLLLRLQQDKQLSIVLISHDMATIRHVAHSMIVMFLGQVVEDAPTSALTSRPLHPYTEALLSAVPIPDPPTQRARRRITLHGELPNPADPPSGCRFRLRCPFALPTCAREEPPLVAVLEGHRVACHRYGNQQYALEASAQGVTLPSLPS